MNGVAKLWEDFRNIKKEVAKTQKGDLFIWQTLKEELEVVEENIQLEIDSYRSKFSKILSYKGLFYRQRAAKVRHKLDELMVIRCEVVKLKEDIKKSLQAPVKKERGIF